MACQHKDRLRVYRRGPGPAYAFQPWGWACACGRFIPFDQEPARSIKAEPHRHNGQCNDGPCKEGAGA